MSASIRRRTREATEAVLRKQAKTVRMVLSAIGAEQAPTLPEIVQIESTNICNAKCVFCPRDEMHRDEGYMDMALFKKIADECAALNITHMRMHNYGEAFADRNLVEKVRYAKSIGTFIGAAALRQSRPLAPPPRFIQPVEVSGVRQRTPL